MNDIIHGGDLVSAQSQYAIPVEDWLDLSTGINPVSYPVPRLNAELFQRLPYQSDQFKAAINNYYGAEGLACNGTQRVIEMLPALLPKLPVLLPECGYQEHRHSWAKRHNKITYYPANDQSKAIETIEHQLASGSPKHLLLINPNNPSGLSISPEQVYRWAEQLQDGAYLIVDEAFVDLHPEHSVLDDYAYFRKLENLVVLRSFGKFFGLAGIRLGFVFSNNSLQKQLQSEFGPWSVNGPAQAIASAALNDASWQTSARNVIRLNAQATTKIWQPLFNKVAAKVLNGAGLFITASLSVETAKHIYHFLAERGVLIRLVQVDEIRPQSSDFTKTEKAETCLLRSGLIDAQEEKQSQKMKQVIGELLLTLN